MSDYEILKEALLRLDDLCDGARALDGMGFNGTHSRMGKTLAAKINRGEVLSPTEQKIGIGIIQTYRYTQLPDLVFPNPANYTIFGEVQAPPKTSKPIKTEKAVETKAPPPPPVEKHNVFTRDAVIIIKLNQLVDDFYPTMEKVRELKEVRRDSVNREYHVPRRYAPEIMEIFNEGNADIYHLVRTWAAEQIVENTRREAILAQRKKDEELSAFVNRQVRASTPSIRQTLEGFGVTLKIYQEVPLELYRILQRGFVIGDYMGLGKTFEALAIAFEYLTKREALGQEPRPVFVVCPPSLVYNWYSETKKALTSVKYSPMILNGKNVFPIPSQYVRVFIVPDSILSAWERYIIETKPGVVIYDEAHRYKDVKTMRSRSMIAVARSADINLPLTGTPIENSPEEFWPLLTAIDPAPWGDYTHFKRTYTEGRYQIESLSELSRPYMIRRTLVDCGTEIPPKSRFSVVVPMSDEGREKYDARMDEFFQEMERRERLSLPCGAIHLQMLAAMKQAAWEGKKDYVLEWIDNFLAASTGKLVVAGLHLGAIAYMQKFLTEKKIKCIRVTGKESGQEKQKNIVSFQTDKNVRVALLTMKAGGMGHTLTAAQDTVTTELWWTPTSHDQMEGRTNRIGQNEKTRMWYLLADNTIDTMIFKRLAEKLEMIDTIMSEQSLPFDPKKSLQGEVLQMLWDTYNEGKGRRSSRLIVAENDQPELDEGDLQY